MAGPARASPAPLPPPRPTPSLCGRRGRRLRPPSCSGRRAREGSAAGGPALASAAECTAGGPGTGRSGLCPRGSGGGSERGGSAPARPPRHRRLAARRAWPGARVCPFWPVTGGTKRGRAATAAPAARGRQRAHGEGGAAAPRQPHRGAFFGRLKPLFHVKREHLLVNQGGALPKINGVRLKQRGANPQPGGAAHPLGSWPRARP